MGTYEQVVASVTGAGSKFEIVEEQSSGLAQRVFRYAPQSLTDLFDSARSRGDETFLVYEDERWSFEKVMSEVDALAACLLGKYGVSKGDRVAIAMRNYPEWIVSFAAITSVGAISVSFNAWWVEEEIEFALADSGASVVIADSERAERSIKAAEEHDVAIIGVRLPSPLGGVDEWSDVVVSGAPRPEVEIASSDDATILYTSGTTGRPKGAVATHGSIIHSLMAFGCGAAITASVNQLAQEETDSSAGSTNPPVTPVLILIVPLFHVTGCIPVMLSCFANGLKLVMMYRWSAERALQLIERERVTQFVGVPTQSWDLLESPDFDKYDTSSMLKIGGGGAPAPPKLVQRVEDSFSAGGPTIGYGMTETNAYGPQNSGPDYIRNPTSTGRATPVMDIEVRDPTGEEVPRGDLGEICFKGPMLIRGYWNRPEATAETIRDGWLYTGDIGRMDSEGFVYVEDRAKDMILRGGENVYSAEVEAAIYEHPAVYEAAVFGIPHERLGEEVATTVCVRTGHSLSPEEFQQYLREHIAPFKVPTIVTLVDDALPRNASGKILKTELRDQLLAENP